MGVYNGAVSRSFVVPKSFITEFSLSLFLIWGILKMREAEEVQGAEEEHCRVKWNLVAVASQSFVYSRRIE